MKFGNITLAMTLIMTMPAAQAVTDSATLAPPMPDHTVTTDAPIAGHGLLLATGGGMMEGGAMGGSGGSTQPMNEGMSHDSPSSNAVASGGDTGPIKLKDGSMLYTNDSGNMRMIGNDGKRIEMEGWRYNGNRGWPGDHDEESYSLENVTRHPQPEIPIVAAGGRR